MAGQNRYTLRTTIKLSTLFLVAFVALRHIFHELHEFGHMTAGRLLCGAWGTRDFNRVASIVSECSATDTINIVVALAGPMVNYCAIWIGALLIRGARTPARISWGLALIFASLPLARLFTALFGGGDEMGVGRSVFADPLMARIVVTAVISALMAYPLYIAYQALSGARHRLGFFLGFLILPMLLEGAVVLLLLNYLLLTLGILNQAWLFGAPALVLLVLLAALAVFAIFRKYIASLARSV